MTHTQIPAWLSAGINSIRWPLDEKSHLPLRLKSLEAMKRIRGERCQSGPECPCFTESSSFLEFLAHMPESFERILSQQSRDARHFGLVSVALVLLGNGHTDEAHSLLTPLSYPLELPFGYGPSLCSDISEEVRTYASYAHALVHRREGSHVGEFGMTGFDNASYWSSNVLRSPGVDSLPGAQLHQGIARLKDSYMGSSSVQDWCDRHGFKKPMEAPYFEARPVHDLCATVLEQRGSDIALRDFAEELSELEVRIILASALQRAGFDVNVSQVTTRSS